MFSSHSSPHLPLLIPPRRDNMSVEKDIWSREEEESKFVLEVRKELNKALDNLSGGKTQKVVENVLNILEVYSNEDYILSHQEFEKVKDIIKRR